MVGWRKVRAGGVGGASAAAQKWGGWRWGEEGPVGSLLAVAAAAARRLWRRPVLLRWLMARRGGTPALLPQPSLPVVIGGSRGGLFLLRQVFFWRPCMFWRNSGAEQGDRHS